MVTIKKLRINGEHGSEIDLDVLRTFDVEEWVQWIDSRFCSGTGQDMYGFSVGGTHARVEPSECFGEVRDSIRKGKGFPNAEQALAILVSNYGKEKSKYYSYHGAELASIAQTITRPNLGYPDITSVFAEKIRNEKPNRIDATFLERSLGLLSHMQKFEDKQYRDIYSDFLRPREDIGDNPAMTYRNAFLGLQVSYDLHRVDEEALRKILELDKGDERELEVVFTILGRVLERKRRFYFDGIREEVRKAKEAKNEI